MVVVLAVLAPIGSLWFAAVAGAQPAVYAVDFVGNRVVPLVGSSAQAAIPVGSDPAGIAITPDGARAYVANASSASVSVIDTASGVVIETIRVGEGPTGVAITPNGRRVYVTNVAEDTVSVIDTDSKAVVRTIEIEHDAEPFAVAITPDGRSAYVAGFLHKNVTVIDIATNNVKDIIDVADNPTALAVTPDGRWVYATSMYLSLLPDQDDGTVTVIDTVTDTVAKELRVGPDPAGIAIAPDGKTAFVTHLSSGDITIIDTQTNAVTGTIHSLSGPAALAITADGRTAYVNDMRAGSVSVLDLQTDPPTKKAEVPIGGGGRPDLQFAGIAIAPSRTPIAELAAPQAAYAGLPITFDASTSSGDGGIESYGFDFGDGESATSTEPTATHTYAEPGTYQATVTVDDGTLCEPVPAYLPHEVFPFTGQTAYCSGPAKATSQPVEIQVEDLPPLGLSISLPRKQPSLRAIRVSATCANLDCTATASGTLVVRRRGAKAKRFKLKAAAAALSADTPTTLAPGIPAKARRAARKALKARGRVRAQVRVQASGLGDQRQARTGRVRFGG